MLSPELREGRPRVALVRVHNNSERTIRRCRATLLSVVEESPDTVFHRDDVHQQPLKWESGAEEVDIFPHDDAFVVTVVEMLGAHPVPKVNDVRLSVRNPSVLSVRVSADDRPPGVEQFEVWCHLRRSKAGWGWRVLPEAQPQRRPLSPSTTALHNDTATRSRGLAEPPADKTPGSDSDGDTDRETVSLVPDRSDCWWYLGSIRDEPAMQVVARWHVTNLTDDPVQLLGVSLVELDVEGSVLIRHPDMNVFGSYPVPGGAMTKATTDFWVQPPRQEEGEDLLARLEFVDNFGARHLTEEVRFQSRPRARPSEPEFPTESLYSISDPIVKQVAAVLKAEVDRYRSCGRQVGGLGSVETTFAGQLWRGVGTDWREAGSPRQQEIVDEPIEGAISSDNCAALLRVFDQCAHIEEQTIFVDALLERLRRDSEYSAVGYLIALVLFRLGRLSDGLTRARSELHGDRRHGFSDFLRLIDGLLRFEHPRFSEDLLDALEQELEGVEEDCFRIPQRAVAIRAHRLRSDRFANGE